MGEGVGEGLGAAPHEVGDDEGGGSRHALRAVNEHAGVGEGTDELEVVEGVVEDGGDVLGRRVVEPEGLVDEVAAEVIGAARGPDAVEHVGDAVAAEGVAVAGGGVAAEVEVVGDSGAVEAVVVVVVGGGGGGAGGVEEAGVIGVEVGPGGEGGAGEERLKRRQGAAIGFREIGVLGIGIGI